VTYRYTITYRSAPDPLVAVEAWPRDKSVALPREIHRPSFTIGKLEGTRTIMLWTALNDLSKRYRSRKRGNFNAINLPPEEPSATADAYRLGLAAAALQHISDSEAADNALIYIIRATQEEIWFWASKYLGVVDEGIKTERVVEALCVLSSSK